LDLIIRAIQKEDIQSVYSLLKLYHKFRDFNHDYFSDFDLMKEVLSNESIVKFYVAELDSEIVGFILFNESFDLYGRSIFIEDNFVLDKYRGKKIGSSLFSKVLEYALKDKINKIKWNVDNKDFSFIEMYKGFGANLTSNIETYKLTRQQLIELSKINIAFDSNLYKIRGVNNRDLPEIKDFLKSKLNQTDFNDNFDIYDLMKFSLGENALFKILLIEVDNEIIGLITYFDFFSALYGKASHIQIFLIKEEYQSIGMDKLFMSYLINKLTEKKYNYLTIDTNKNDDICKNRMHFFGADLIENNMIVEMDKYSLKQIINNN
jgi:GNAT superfamily N-acetyltransferase